jgi:hypothetical protein
VLIVKIYRFFRLVYDSTDGNTLVLPSIVLPRGGTVAP